MGSIQHYEVLQEPIHTVQPKRLVCIGAGIAGIAAAYKYQRDLENVDFVIYEKNHDVGGTWLENRYPGCACDIPAHGYTYSWEGNPNWSKFYVSAEEIFEYFKGCAIKWDCMKYIKLSHRVIEARWSEHQNQWLLKVENLVDGTIFDDCCDVVLSATGILNKWQWPKIPGINNFRGKLLHSARWDQDYNFEGKSIAVIGAGSSAIQIVPSLQPVVKKMVNFIRNPTWITPEFGESLAKDGRATTFTPEEITRFNADKKYFLEYRKLIQNTGSASFSLYYKGSELQQQAFVKFANLMEERLGHDDEMCQKLIPKFPVGCKRFTPGSGYLESLIKPNVQVVFSGVEEITANGIRGSDGIEHVVDAIICATGFDCSHRPAFPVIGREGRELGEFWKDQPRHYLSVAAPGFPNYFITGGPNSPIANGSLISGLETEIDYAFECLRSMQAQGIASMDVTDEAVDDFLEHRDALMNGMVWSGGCRSWYKNGTINGPVIGPWIGSTWHFNEALKTPRLQDYRLVYKWRNRFRYLGNGRTIAELTTGADLASYMTEPGA